MLCTRRHRAVIYKLLHVAQEAAELGAPVLPPVGSDRQLEIEENWLADMVEASNILKIVCVLANSTWYAMQVSRRRCGCAPAGVAGR